MKKISTSVGVCVILTLIGLLYYVHDDAAHTDQQIRIIKSDINSERDTLLLLQAEWGSLNDPTRLQRLARKHLNLQELRISQIRNLRDANAAQLASFPIGDKEGKAGFDTR